jgi:hypothetical protein
MFEFPPVNDSLGSLTPGRWALLLCSFIASLALFALWMLMLSHHVMWVWSILLICTWTIAKVPMQIYAQNSKARVVGKVYLTILVGYGLYVGWNRLETQLSKSPIILPLLIALCCWAYWFTLETAKVNEQFLKRLGALQEQINSIESTVEHLKRNI